MIPLKSVRTIGDRFGETTTLNSIGRVYNNLGEYQKALDFYQQGLSIRREIGDRVGEGRSLNNIGVVYANLGAYLKALEFYQQAQQVARISGDRAVEGTILGNIGQVYQGLGQYSKSLSCLTSKLHVLISNALATGGSAQKFE